MKLSIVLALWMAATARPKEAPPTHLTQAEADALQGLAGDGYEVSAEQAFRVTLDDWGAVEVAIGCASPESGGSRCAVLAARKGSLLAKEPVGDSAKWQVCEPSALAFRDVDGDGKTDILAMVDCDTGIGPSIAQPLQVGEVLFHRGDTLKPDARVTKVLEALGRHGRAPETLKDLERVARKALTE